MRLDENSARQIKESKNVIPVCVGITCQRRLCMGWFGAFRLVRVTDPIHDAFLRLCIERKREYSEYAVFPP